MGQGQDKVALSLLDLQPTAIVELFLLYFNTVEKENVFIAFHGGSIFSKSIQWQGIEYLPIPVESEGFEVNANGQMARPKIRISNKDYFMTDLLLNNNDLQFAKIIRKRTFVKYLDDANFDGGNPWGQADASAEISNDTFVISQKTAENKMLVELELTSPLDLDNFEVNNRLILSRYCSWYYRGNGCNYEGPPIETEDGRSISITNPSAWYKAAPWQTGVAYPSGTPVFIENKKIILNDPYDPLKSDYAKIWYVSQISHTGSLQYQPGSNDSYWLRDGCNKKLDGCKKRFRNTTKGVFNTEDVYITNNYVNFSHKNGLNAYTNIAPLAIVDASSSASGFDPYNINDMQTGFPETDSSWASSGSGAPYPWISLTWNSEKTIDRIDLYDRVDLDSNFSGAYLSFYNGASLVKSGTLNSIPNDGSRISTGFSPIAITSLTISGIGCSGSGVGLGEVCVFEPTGLGLYTTNFKTDNINLKDYWQISSWIQFSGGISKTSQYTNVLHNVKQNCQYSGINLFITGGGASQQLILNFATVVASGNPIQYTTIPRSLAVNWSAQNLKPFHIICSGGTATGLSPTQFKQGIISLSGNGQLKTFAITPPSGKISGQSVSGEFFLFKNSSYSSSMDDLKFGINDWQFSDSSFAPNLYDNRPESNTKITSNILFGSTAIWTGSSYQIDRSSFFNRTDSESIDTNASAVGLKPRKYSELKNSYLSGLYAWWDMDLSASYPYNIAASNAPTKIIYLSGDYTSSIDYNETTTYLKPTTNPQTASRSLPFGGFPGTDKYGR